MIPESQTRNRPLNQDNLGPSPEDLEGVHHSIAIAAGNPLANPFSDATVSGKGFIDVIHSSKFLVTRQRVDEFLAPTELSNETFYTARKPLYQA